MAARRSQGTPSGRRAQSRGIAVGLHGSSRRLAAVIGTAAVTAVVGLVFSPDFLSASFNWMVDRVRGSDSAELSGKWKEITVASATSMQIPAEWGYESLEGQLRSSHKGETGIFLAAFPADANGKEDEPYEVPTIGVAVSRSLADTVKVRGVEASEARPRLRKFMERFDYGQNGCRLTGVIPFSWPRHSGYLRRWTGCAGGEWEVLQLIAIPAGGDYVVEAQAFAPDTDYARILVESFKSVQPDARRLAAIEEGAQGPTWTNPGSENLD